MSSNKKLFGKINFFDVIIIVVVAIIGVSVLGIYYSKNKKVANKGVKMTYVLELIDNPIGFSELINIGDSISDSVKNFSMGTITGIEKTANLKVVNDLVNSQIIESETPDKERVLLTVEANVIDNGLDLLVDGAYDIRVGKDVYIKGNRYAGFGYILEIKR